MPFMQLQDYVEMTLIRKRLKYINDMRKFANGRTLFEYEFDDVDFASGGLRNINSLIAKLEEIKVLYGEH